MPVLLAADVFRGSLGAQLQIVDCENSTYDVMLMSAEPEEGVRFRTGEMPQELKLSVGDNTVEDGFWSTVDEAQEELETETSV